MILFIAECGMHLMGHIISVMSSRYQETKGYEQNCRHHQLHTGTFISLSRCKLQKDPFM